VKSRLILIIQQVLRSFVVISEIKEMRSLPELESSRPWGVSRSASYVHGLKDQVLGLGLECSVLRLDCPVLGHGSCDCISGRWVWKLVTAVPHAVIRQISQTLENLSESKMPRVHGKMNSVTWTVSLSHGLEAETGTAMSLRVMIQVDSFHFVNAFVAVVWSQWTGQHGRYHGLSGTGRSWWNNKTRAVYLQKMVKQGIGEHKWFYSNKYYFIIYFIMDKQMTTNTWLKHLR